jgi:SulP family sulfate permease
MRLTSGDVSGAVADLGVFIPLAAALVLVNGLDVGSVLIAAGALLVLAGLVFDVPFPVQPLKALSALAVAGALSPELIHAGGLLIGVLLLALSLTGLADRIAIVFTKPVIRSLQFGVGSLLVISAFRLARQPPEVFGQLDPRVSVILTLTVLAFVWVTAARRWYFLAFALLAASVAVSWVITSPDLGTISLHSPQWGLPDPGLWLSAFVLLVIPQIPLTYGNAVVGVSDLARETFGPRACRVTPGRVALTSGAGNVVSALAGGLPMCHGSSGFSAHVRLGARNPSMNLLLGGSFLLLGVVFADQVLTLFGLVPIWVLAGFLAYAGVRHALLVQDLNGSRLFVAIAAGTAGIATGNLAVTTVLALSVEYLPRAWRRAREHKAGPDRQEVAG